MHENIQKKKYMFTACLVMSSEFTTVNHGIDIVNSVSNAKIVKLLPLYGGNGNISKVLVAISNENTLVFQPKKS